MSDQNGNTVVPAALPQYKVEVIADSSGTWASNGRRFASEAEAREYGQDLSYRWTAVREFRVAVDAVGNGEFVPVAEVR